MKKSLYIFLTSLLLCACSSRNISMDDARRAALKDASLNEGDVSFSKELQDGDSYIFEFSDDEKRYSYTIKGDGSIGSRDYQTINGNNDNSKNHTTGPSTENGTNSSNNGTNSSGNGANSSNNGSNSSMNGSQGTTNSNTNQGSITRDNAITIALSAFDLTKDQVTNITVENEEENGIYVYRVEFYRDNQEYEVDVSRENGEIINKKTEKDDRKVV